MCGQMKFVSSVGHLSLLIGLTLVVLSCSNSNANAEPPAKPITPQEEAMYMALNATEGDLLPNPDLVAKFTKVIVGVRRDFKDMKDVVPIKNQGDWYLGRVRVSNYSPALKQKIDKSEYAPIKEVKVSKTNKKEADLIFTKPFHPTRLSKRLKKEFGAEAEEIWYDPKKAPSPQYIIFTPGHGYYFVNVTALNSQWLFEMDEASGKTSFSGMFGGE